MVYDLVCAGVTLVVVGYFMVNIVIAVNRVIRKFGLAYIGLFFDYSPNF